MKDSLSKYVIAANDSEEEYFHLATDGQDGSYLQESLLLKELVFTICIIRSAGSF